jgi:bacterial leucyl aminopeptidase
MTILHGKIQRLTLVFLCLTVPARAQTIESMVAAVSDSALFTTIAGLQGFGTRWYQEGNALEVSQWVRNQFVAFGLTDVVLDTFVCSNAPQANVIATLHGNLDLRNEIIVGGHIDSRTLPLDRAPGADDDASGTAAVLEIARVMITSGYRPATTIRFIGFAAEEPGLVGSGRYADALKAAGRNVILMINFDMVGYTTNADPERHFYIMEYPPDTETSSLVAAAARSFSSLKPLTTTIDNGNVDSYPFAVHGYPAVTCTEYLDNPYYHKPLDVLSTLDGSYVREITRAGLASILLFDGIPASVDRPVADLPSASGLCQNYPNPFNPSTRIKYTVGGTGGSGLGTSKISLIVYDLLGREVAVLVNERKLPGNYEVTFDGFRLSSGVYICRLTVGGFVASKRMLLLR